MTVLLSMRSTVNQAVAILYQAAQPPLKNGISKPMKPGGYSDSGADIAFALQKAGTLVVTPVDKPDPAQSLDWVFPDTKAGIDQALSQGANVLWLNTILFDAHPIQNYLQKGVKVVGQDPNSVDVFDDKWETNQLLKRQGLPVPDSVIVKTNEAGSGVEKLKFPLVAKPIRGRGSAGVTLVNNESELASTLDTLLHSSAYGDAILVEEFLPGQEVTLTVMPAGIYQIDGQTVEKTTAWSLPPVKRFNHQSGVAPYNGIVAVVNNSQVLSTEESERPAVQTLMQQCEKAAQLINAKAPIRIDCRQDVAGTYYLFDLNMKPNMTGPGRPGRDDQDSLSALAGRRIGWSYQDFLLNMLAQQWTL